MGNRPVRANPPQYHDGSSTARIMWGTCVALLPAAAWGVFLHGPRAAVVLGVSIITAVVCEAAIGVWRRRHVISDGSAALVGLLIAMSMPPGVPLHVPVAAVLFGLLVVKWTFGGLGANWMNIALGGWIFAFFSWTDEMTAWGIDGASSATPLGLVRDRVVDGAFSGGPMSIVRQAGFAVSPLDANVTEWINTRLLATIGINVPEGYVDLFVGFVPGSIGEASSLLLLLGTVFLIATRVIRWEIPAAYFAVFALLTWIFGGLVYARELFSGDVLFHTFSGGLVFALFYLAPDTASAPSTRTGMVIYAMGAGAFTFLFRTWGSYAGGAGFAIVFMNLFVPMINRFTRHRRFGVSRGKHAHASAVAS